MIKSSRLQWIDSLRGIAAIMVVVLHLWLFVRNNVNIPVNIYTKFISFFVSDFFDFGKIGVVVFFSDKWIRNSFQFTEKQRFLVCYDSLF